MSALPGWNEPSWAWSLELERAIATSGAPDEPPLLYRPQAYVRFADGTLVVLDGGPERLVVIPPDGAEPVTARFGSTGQGPGEIWSSNTLLWPAGSDAVWALDPGNSRLSRFSLDGTLEGERSLSIAGMGGFAVLRPGAAPEPVFWKVFLDPVDATALIDSVGALDAERGLVDYFAPMPARVRARRTNRSPPTLFAPKSWLAPVGAAGVLVGRNNGGRFLHYVGGGTLVGVIELPLGPAEIPQSDEPKILADFEAVARGSPSPRVGAIAERYPVWDLMWPMGDSLFALQQSHWSTPEGEDRIPDGHSVWRVFTVRGRYLGAISFPPGFAQPYWIERGRIVGTRRDSLGMATIEVYALGPRRRPGVP